MAPIPRGRRLPNILIIVSEKPYEIKEILVCGGGAPGAPRTPLNPLLDDDDDAIHLKHSLNKGDKCCD